MKHLTIGGLAAAVLLAAAGCSGPGIPRGAASFMTASNSKVALIQWHTASHGRLHGTITENAIGGSGPSQTVSINSERFTGTMRGQSVMLTFAAMYFLNSRAHGTLSGGTLTMWVPQSDGTMREISLSQSDKAGYDRAVAALQKRVRHANLLAAKQQASQRRGSANAQAVQNSQIALSKLYRASSLASGGTLADGLARFADHIQAARARLAKEKADAVRDNKYCVAALTVGGDAKAVDGAMLSMQGDAVSLMSDITNIRYDVATTKALLRHLNKAGVSAPNSASLVIASANANVKPVIAKANSYIDQINTTHARARSIASTMATGKCSGAANGVFVPPIPHLK